MERSGGSVCGYGGFFPIGCSGAALCWLRKFIAAGDDRHAQGGRDSGIRVNAVAPGLVNTASNIATMKPKDLKRWTKREDVAEAVVFLASPAAAGITEQVITVTGWGL